MFCCIHQMDSLGIFEKSNSEFHYIPELIYQSSLLSQVVKVLCRANYRAARRRRRFWGVFLSFLRAKPSKRFEVLRIPPLRNRQKFQEGGGILSDIVGYASGLGSTNLSRILRFNFSYETDFWANSFVAQKNSKISTLSGSSPMFVSQPLACVSNVLAF